MYNTLYVLVGLYSRGSKSNEAETTKLNEAWPQEHTTDIIATSNSIISFSVRYEIHVGREFKTMLSVRRWNA